MNELLLIEKLCSYCFHSRSEHWFNRECHEVIINDNIWNNCYCRYFRNIIEIKVTIIELIKIESFEIQLNKCNNCKCSNQTHVHFFENTENLDYYLSLGKCDNIYCPIVCEKFEISEVNIFD